MGFDDDDHLSKAIAKHWGVNVDDLGQASWELEEIEGNGGETYGYVVRFAENTDPELLEQLGVDQDELTREVSLWAFERPEPEAGVYSLDAPFPDPSDSDNDNAENRLADLSPGQFVGLYEKWCDATKEREQRKHYWTYIEKVGGRDAISGELAQTIRSHYDRLERIAEDVERLGYKVAAKILSEAMPQTPKGRSGDLGEILATELVEEEIGLRVPVRRLRYKDGRNMAMRGDDFIGAGYDGAGEKLWLLKGEAKSNKVLGKATVTSARKVLNRDNGRCTPDSLLFVANRLLESNDPADNELGRSLRDEVGLKSLNADRIDHMLFTVSGNGPHASLKEDLDATGTNRDHYVVNIHVEDHQDFISAMYQEAEDLGDN